VAIAVTPSMAARLGPDLPSVLPLTEADLVKPPEPEILDAIVLDDEPAPPPVPDASGYEVVEEEPRPPRAVPIEGLPPVAAPPPRFPAAPGVAPPPPPPAAPPPRAVVPPPIPPVVPASPATGNDLVKLTGQVLGSYQVGARIAEGQSGDVFHALDTRSGTAVAIKILRAEFSRHPQAVERFFRGARTAQPLRHPHLLPVLDFGVTGPHCWLAMEYIDGASLVQVIGQIGVAGMLDWRYAYRVGVHITRALCFVHQHQVVHRNLTARNILVRHSDKAALLGDLALAKAIEDFAPTVTQPGEVVGDVHFMSPERLQNAAAVDARSDIYSLGALLYALLTGRPPFSGSGLMDTVALILQAAPESPRKRQLSISEMFADLVLKMLAKRPDERHQSAGELLQELNRIGKFQGIAV
jgi:serine/threonine protein kinase